MGPVPMPYVVAFSHLEIRTISNFISDTYRHFVAFCSEVESRMGLDFVCVSVVALCQPNTSPNQVFRLTPQGDVRHQSIVRASKCELERNTKGAVNMPTWDVYVRKVVTSK